MGEKKGFLNFLKIDSLFDHLTAFIEAKVEIYKLEFEEAAAGVISKVIIALLLFCLCWFFVMFLSVALGFYLSALLNSAFEGFLIIAGFYLVLFLLLFLLRNKIGLKELLENKMSHLFKTDK